MSIAIVIALCWVAAFAGGVITNLINNSNFKKQIVKKDKEYEDKLAELEEKCVAVTQELKAKDEYIANMVHDIRTPINAVNGMTELILRENNSIIVTEYANSIKRTGNVLNQLVNDVLDISKIESGNMELVEDTYDIVEIFSDVITLIKDKCNKKHLKFEVRIDENIPSVMYGDENRLRQILMNLLSNAVKYTAEGKVLFEAKLKGDIDKDMAYVYFAVEDTGSGIKEEDAANIFKSFKRVEERKNNKIEGTGLGLNIVYKLLEIMGSKIQLKSKYGVGSRFYFTIKQRVIEKEGIGNFIAKYNEQLDKKTTYRVSFEAPDAAILVVDDNEMNLLVTKKLLENTKMKIDTRKSGMECLEAVSQTRYNLILMDVKMPEMDGIETLKRIRGGALLNKQTPVIALTADATRGVREKYLDDGFSDYISKPFDPIKLEKKIMKFIPNTLIKVQNSSYTSDRKMSYLLNVNEGLKYCSGDMDMYNEVLAAYLKLGQENIKNINKYYQDVDWENYDIQAHSLKSTSQTVGAISLYEMAKKLEEAAKKKDTSYIIYNHEEMIDTYKKVLVEIEEYFHKEGKEIKKN